VGAMKFDLGQPVAMIVAETPVDGADAAEAIQLDIEDATVVDGAVPAVYLAVLGALRSAHPPTMRGATERPSGHGHSEPRAAIRRPHPTLGRVQSLAKRRIATKAFAPAHAVCDEIALHVVVVELKRDHQHRLSFTLRKQLVRHIEKGFFNRRPNGSGLAIRTPGVMGPCGRPFSNLIRGLVGFFRRNRQYDRVMRHPSHCLHPQTFTRTPHHSCLYSRLTNAVLRPLYCPAPHFETKVREPIVNRCVTKPPTSIFKCGLGQELKYA